MTRRTRTIALVAGLAVVQVVAVLVYLRVDAARRAPTTFATTTLPGSMAPSIAVAPPDGGSLDAAAPGRGVRVLHFWATWCKPCVKELPTLLAEGRRTPGVELVAISVDEHWADVRRFFPDGIPPEVVRARDRDAHHRYGSRTLPDSYVVSPDGRLVERVTGARDWSQPAARQYLRSLAGRFR